MIRMPMKLLAPARNGAANAMPKITRKASATAPAPAVSFDAAGAGVASAPAAADAGEGEGDADDDGDEADGAGADEGALAVAVSAFLCCASTSPLITSGTYEVVIDTYVSTMARVW